jgi:hypothetical protein
MKKTKKVVIHDEQTGQNEQQIDESKNEQDKIYH